MFYETQLFLLGQHHTTTPKPPSLTWQGLYLAAFPLLQAIRLEISFPDMIKFDQFLHIVDQALVIHQQKVHHQVYAVYELVWIHILPYSDLLSWFWKTTYQVMQGLLHMA